MIFTVLHAGGKFEHGNYKTAGGLHGVGASVVNALSKELVATVKRDGAQWEMRFKQGKPVGAAEEARRGARQRHHGVTSIPTPTIFPKIEFDAGDHQGAARSRELPAQGRSRSSSRTKRRREGRLRARRRASSTTCKKIVAERGAQAGARRAVHADTQGRQGMRLDLVLQWTRGDRRARPLATSTASRPARAARTRAACAPASARRSAISSRRTTCRRKA